MTAPNDAVIALDGVTKTYSLARSPRERLLGALFGLRPRQAAEHVALDDVSLTVRRGETVGLLGVNGAGKSTLLQLVVGVLTPSVGTVRVDGSVAALLELGAGFNPEWTGRQNVEFQCRTLGLSARDVPARLAAVEDFAAVGRFFEQPVRTYSSGMFLRVAFAAAVASDPDILVVDEALAVGDAKFQTKCFARFEEFQRAGRTILFVTHAPELVARFCTRGIVLDRGRVTFDGPAAEATRRYISFLYGPAEGAGPRSLDLPPVDEAAMPPGRAIAEDGASAVAAVSSEVWGEAGDNLHRRPFYNPHERRIGDGRARILDAAFLSGEPPGSHLLSAGQEVRLALRIRAEHDIAHPAIGLVVKTPDNVTVYGSSTGMRGESWPAFRAGAEIVATIAFRADLVAGDYFLDLGLADIVDGGQESVDFRFAAIHIYVSAPLTAYGIADLGASFVLVSASEGSGSGA